MSLSATQLVTLRMIADGKVAMFGDGRSWIYRVGYDTINRRTIRALEKAGLVACRFYRDSQGVELTEAGRQRIAEWNRNRRRAA